jgi:hypothetical protein
MSEDTLRTADVHTYYVHMNITLSIDESLVEEARRLALARGTSLNQLIRDYLEDLVRPGDPKAISEELRRLTSEGGGRSRGWRFNRDELHERG